MQNRLIKLFSMAMLTASISVVAQAQTIKTLITFQNSTLSISANPVTNQVYVIVPTINGTTDSLAVIDGNQDVVTATLTVPLGAQAVTVDYFANRVYVAGCDYTLDPSPCTVVVFNGKTNALLSTIPVTTTPGLGLTGITVNPLNHLVYVANSNDNVVNIINGCKAKLAGSISLKGNSPTAIAIDPLRNRLFVPFGTNLTGVVDARKKQLISTTTFGVNTISAAANFVTGHVFVTDSESGPSMTGAFDTTGKVLGSVVVDDAPQGVDVDPITNLVFVAASALDELQVIDGSTNTLKNTVQNVPANYVAVNLATEKVYVSGRNGVTVLTEK